MKELLKTNKLSTTGTRNDLLIRLQEARILPLYPNINEDIRIKRNELYKIREYPPRLLTWDTLDRTGRDYDVYLSPQEKIQRKQQGKNWGFKSKGSLDGLPLPQYIRPTEIKEIKPIQINKITPSSRKIMLEEPELQYIPENHINTSPKNIYKMNQQFVDEQIANKKQMEELKKKHEKEIKETEKEIKKIEKEYKKQKKEDKKKLKLTAEQKEINRLLKKMEKVRDEISKKFERLENLKTFKAKQNAFEIVKRRITELKNVWGILVNYGLKDDYRIQNMEGEIRHIDEMTFMTDNYLKKN
jgi:hypothetical protein